MDHNFLNMGPCFVRLVVGGNITLFPKFILQQTINNLLTRRIIAINFLLFYIQTKVIGSLC